jgi:hypothetical protein
VKIDHIDVSRVDWAVGVLRGALGSMIFSGDLRDKIEEAIPHVRGAARAVERAQRDRLKVRSGPRRPRRRKKA